MISLHPRGAEAARLGAIHLDPPDARPQTPRMTIQTRIVTEDEADIRLDRWFRRHVPGLQQSLIQKLCRTGQIRVDGARADTNTRLLAGQSIRMPPVDAPAEPKPVSRVDPHDAKDLQQAIIYQDDQILVINKPYGLPVQGGPGITRHLDGMLDALRFGSEHRPRLVHRLDRDTTGVLLLARTPGTAGKLAALFRGRENALVARAGNAPLRPNATIRTAPGQSPITRRWIMPRASWRGWN
jgi:23S rRNA pseudouridine955/2504/2580 synthase